MADLPELGNTGLAESFSKLNLFSEENGTNNKKKIESLPTSGERLNSPHYSQVLMVLDFHSYMQLHFSSRLWTIWFVFSKAQWGRRGWGGEWVVGS